MTTWQPCPCCGWYARIIADYGTCVWCGLVWYIGGQVATR